MLSKRCSVQKYCSPLIFTEWELLNALHSPGLSTRPQNLLDWPEQQIHLWVMMHRHSVHVLYVICTFSFPITFLSSLLATQDRLSALKWHTADMGNPCGFCWRKHWRFTYIFMWVLFSVGVLWDFMATILHRTVPPSTCSHVNLCFRILQVLIVLPWNLNEISLTLQKLSFYSL